MLTENIDEFQIAASFIVLRVEHTHCREERQTRTTVAIKAPQQEYGLVGDGFNPPRGNGDARVLGERQCHGLPEDGIHFIALVRKLGNREMAIAVPNRGLGTGAAEG
jgi:hypothetical protein